MTPEEFKLFWQKNYLEALPIGHYFKHSYPKRWLRIHSLPDSKRYPDTKKEWDILLKRQNTVINDLLLDQEEFYLVSGFYEGETEDKCLKKFNFSLVDRLALHELHPEEFDSKIFYNVYLTKEKWGAKKFDSLLKLIANDEGRAFFMTVKENCLISPYDGGIDLILKDEETRNHYKEKYKAWLSKREDGL